MSPLASAPETDLDRASLEFYQHAMRLMQEGNLPFLVGGAYAFARYTGIERHTKDFDVFIRREDFDRACRLFEAAGYQAELTFPHWIGKAYKGEDFVDLIFSAGNGVAVVDELWFDYAVPAHVFDVDVKLIPPEEMIWSKGRLAEETKRGDLPEKICYGTIVSRQQYLVDVKEWGYRDARLEPLGNMSEEEIEEWTKGIEVDGHQ